MESDSWIHSTSRESTQMVELDVRNNLIAQLAAQELKLYDAEVAIVQKSSNNIRLNQDTISERDIYRKNILSFKLMRYSYKKQSEQLSKLKFRPDSSQLYFYDMGTNNKLLRKLLELPSQNYNENIMFLNNAGRLLKDKLILRSLIKLVWSNILCKHCLIEDAICTHKVFWRIFWAQSKSTSLFEYECKILTEHTICKKDLGSALKQLGTKQINLAILVPITSLNNVEESIRDTLSQYKDQTGHIELKLTVMDASE